MEWEREEWIEQYQNGAGISEIARRCQISRKALYKWLARLENYGVEGLQDQSRAPRRQPEKLSQLWCERIRAARQEHARWGAPKLVWSLQQKYPGEVLPPISTVGRVLRDSGLSHARRRIRAHGTGPMQVVEEANQSWAIDFKGWCRTGDGARCEPLTITDQATRYLLYCQSLGTTRGASVRAAMQRVFCEYGLPERIRSDNGAPFASTGECGLTRLSVWWTELGIQVERIDPGHPQQNGRHERMHRTLAEATMQPPAATLRQQQRRLEEFRQEYNQRRPHQALSQRVPASLYVPSLRPLPARTPEPAYQASWPQRTVCAAGKFKWQAHSLFLSHALTGKRIAFEPLQDGVWRVWFHRLAGHVGRA